MTVDDTEYAAVNLDLASTIDTTTTMLVLSLIHILHANQAQFPKTIWQLVQLACQRAGVALASSSLPINGSYSVQAFYADDLTCRQIISWAAEAAGCYAHMNADGKLQFLTYSDKRSTPPPCSGPPLTAYSRRPVSIVSCSKMCIRDRDQPVLAAKNFFELLQTSTLPSQRDLKATPHNSRLTA